MNTRRFFIATWLALAGFRWRARAQVAEALPIKYATLTRPVSIPTQAVVTPWRPVTFVAEADGGGDPKGAAAKGPHQRGAVPPWKSDGGG